MILLLVLLRVSRDALDRNVVRFGRTGCEDDLLRIGIDKPTNKHTGHRSFIMAQHEETPMPREGGGQSNLAKLHVESPGN